MQCQPFSTLSVPRSAQVIRLACMMAGRWRTDFLYANHIDRVTDLSGLRRHGVREDVLVLTDILYVGT